MKKRFFTGAGHLWTWHGGVWHYGRAAGYGARCRNIHTRRRQYDYWYAFGVVIGAPIMALLSSRFSLKSVMLFWLACVFSAIPCLPSPVATPCWRLAGWFPVSPRGVLWRRRDYPVENRAAGKVTAAVAGMIGGMTIANPVGVPGGTAWASLQLALYLCAYRGI